jgi:hypothetical protein
MLQPISSAHWLDPSGSRSSQIIFLKILMPTTQIDEMCDFSSINWTGLSIGGIPVANRIARLRFGLTNEELIGIQRLISLT